MIKSIKKILINCVLLLIIVVVYNGKNVLASEAYTTEYASYNEDTRLIEQKLGYGIEHIKTTAISTAKECTNPEGYGLIDSPQTVNILSVPSAKNIRIVNYTYPYQTGWTKQTLTKIVQNFELNNPGWTVLAGVNGDFYDINGTDKALPYHTNGTTVSEGELLRAEERKSVGYTNDGSTTSMIYTEQLAFSKYHVLTIYDENDEIIKEIEIDKINEEPLDGETAVFYTYKVNKDSNNDGSIDTAETIEQTVSNKNSYIIEAPVRCLPTNEPELYARGQISSIDKEITLRFGQFAIVSTNEEVKELLEIGTTVRVQKEVLGDLAKCDQIMNVGSTLVENGVVSLNNSDGMRKQRHPRTCIGVKEDGTMMFFVIDGRQQASGFYGMTQDEQGAMMAYYGCTLGFNVDGGGSSTFGVRDEYGKFQIMNTPSDNNERPVSNALLVVVPQLQLQKSDITDNSIKLSYDTLSKGINVENIKVTIGDITKEMTSNEFLFDGLKPSVEYELSYEYDITYNDITTHVIGEKYKFTTGKVPPKVEYAYFDINSTNIKLTYNITDTSELASFICLEYTGGLEFVDGIGTSTMYIELNSIQKFDFNLVIEYSVECIPNRNTSLDYAFKWYPLSVDMTKYNDEELKTIDNIINSVNDKLNSLSKEEVINLIKESVIKIDKIYNDRLVAEYKTSKLEELNNSFNINEYSNGGLEQINIIIDNIKITLEKLYDLEEIDNLITTAINNIENVKTYNEELIELEESKIKKIEELELYVSEKHYNKKNQQKIASILSDTINKINNAKDEKEVNNIYNESLELIDQIKVKTCNSNSIVIYSLIISLITIIYVLKKKH